MDYFEKYQKYKSKYNQLKDSCGGARSARDEVRVFFLTKNVYDECLREDKSIKAQHDKLEEKIKKRRNELRDLEANALNLEQMEVLENKLEHESSDIKETLVGGLFGLFSKSASEKVKAQHKKLESSHSKSEKKIASIQAKAAEKEKHQHAKKESASKKYELVKQKIKKKKKKKIQELEKKLEVLNNRLKNSTRKCNLSVYGNKLYNVLTTSTSTLKESVTYLLENHAPYVVQNSKVLSFIDTNGKVNDKLSLEDKFDYTNKSKLLNVKTSLQEKNHDKDFKHMVVVKKNISSPDILISVYDIDGDNFNIRSPIRSPIR